MSNDISGLREILFETLRGVKSGNVSTEKAKAINETAQSIINTAKVEVDFLKATGKKKAVTDFLGPPIIVGRQTATGLITEKVDPATGVRSTMHTLRG